MNFGAFTVSFLTGTIFSESQMNRSPLNRKFQKLRSNHQRIRSFQIQLHEKFSPTVGKLSRPELEELLFQKITESLMFSNETTEIRSLLEKQIAISENFKKRMHNVKSSTTTPRYSTTSQDYSRSRASSSGSDKEVSEWLPQNTIELASNKISFPVERFYKCNAFVHQAKIQPGIDSSGLCDPKLAITANGMHETTKVLDDPIRS